MIGYYVHRQGSGHLHRASAVAALWGSEITGLSSLPRPLSWVGEWVQLEDDAPASAEADVTADGHLHWVPRGHPGLRARMGALSAWLVQAQPSVLVSDVSVEVTLLARLHGVPVVSVVLPGLRSDSAHLLGYGVSDALVAMWPPTAGIRTGLPPRLGSRIRHLGGLSRFPSTAHQPSSPPGKHVALLWGSGGAGPPVEVLRGAQQQSLAWTWTLLGGQSWTADPFAVLCAADVVVTHAGQNSVAETAASRTPAIVIPQPRPFQEQQMTAEALRAPWWPALVVDDFPRAGWDLLLEQASGLDGGDWEAWCDDRAAERFVAVLREVSTS